MQNQNQKQNPDQSSVGNKFIDGAVQGEVEKALASFDFSDDENFELPEPSDDYERFLAQHVYTEEARKLLLHFANVRAAELEHRANCWKLLRMSRGDDLKKLFAIVMKEEGAPSLEEFETNAFIKPFSTKPFKDESSSDSYTAYAEQFFPSISVKNYFPDVGDVNGEIPEVFQDSKNYSFFTHQPPLILDPSCYETKIEKQKDAKGGKKKKSAVTHNPVPLFSSQQLKKCVPVLDWVKRYSSEYSSAPTSQLLLRELDPEYFGDIPFKPKSTEFKLISEEFDEELEEYKKTVRPDMIELGKGLAVKCLEKRLETMNDDYERNVIETFRKLKDNMTDEIAMEVNSIMRYKKSDPQKFFRLERCLFLHNYEL